MGGYLQGVCIYSSTDEEKENKNKQKIQGKNIKTMQRNIVSKTKLLLETNNLKLKSPTFGRDVINSSSELLENFQQSIKIRSEKSSSQEEKGRESDYKSNSDTNDNSPLSHFSKKNLNSCKDDDLDYAESPQRMSLFFYEKKIMELQQKIDYIEKENKKLRETMEKTTMLYKKSQEKVSSCIIIHQQLKEVLLQESESELQDSMYNSEMNGFNSIETSTPSDCTTSKNSKRSAKDSGFGEITNVEKKLKTSEEPQKVMKIIFDKKIPHLPDSSGKSFGTKITPLDSTESMMHLRHSYSIPYDEWKSLLKQPSESLFCKKLLEALYPWDELKRICVKQKVKTPILTPNGANPKSEIPNEFHDMTKKALEYYIKYKANGDYVSTRILLDKLKSVGHYFSEHIKAVAIRPEPKNKQPKNK